MNRVFCFFLSMIMLLSFCSCRENAKYFDTKPVDNYINNFIAGGNLVRIDDTLYYNYQHSGLDYGLLEITKNSKKKIYSDQSTLKDAVKLYDSIYTNGKKLFRYDDVNFFYEYKNKSWKGVEWKSINKDFYVSTDREFGEFDLCSVETNEIIHKDIIQFYPYKSGCIYASYSNALKPCEFYYYDNNTKNSILLGKLKGYSVFNFIVEDEFLVFYGQDNLENYNIYYLSIYDFNNIESFVNQEECYGFNVFNSVVYICSYNGIVSFDLKTKETTKICDEVAEECYILDDEYLYFVDYKDKLSRVKLETKEVETAFIN